MATCLVRAVAADREIRPRRKRREQGDQAPRRRTSHLAAVAPRVTLPALWCERLGQGVRYQRRARCEIGQPEIEVVELPVVALRDTPRRPPHGSEANTLALHARRCEAHDANR